MSERTNLRLETDAVLGDSAPRPRDPTRVLPIISGPPGVLSPLAGRRILLTAAQGGRPDHARGLADDMAFQDALALAAHLAALDAEVALAPVGEGFSIEDLRSISRCPGVTAIEGEPIPSPQENASASAARVAGLAEKLGAELIILHDPALAAARRDPRPTVVFCDRSRMIAWRLQNDDRPADERIRAAMALERLGLHAADRVISPSRALASEIVALHGLTLPPVIVPPVFRKPESHEKRSGEPGLILAGAANPDPRDVLALDRAVAQIYGQTLLFDMGEDDLTAALCLEQIHRLPAMSAQSAEALLVRAAAFYCPSTGPDFERLIWRAASAGCALILPDTKVNREFWQDAAHFTKQADDCALACVLRRMLEDDDHRRRLAAAALRRARALSSGPAWTNLQKTLSDALGPTPLTAAL